MTVYLMHGVVHHWFQRALVHRNYVPLAAFELHLRQRKTPYVGWSAGWPSGDVLTVDDATRGGAEACSIARQLGHEVIFFVNPLQVSTGDPYFFSLLAAIIDGRTTSCATYGDKTFDLRDARDICSFRRAVKRMLMVLPAEESLQAVQEMAHVLGASEAEIPSHALPVSVAELRVLRDIGVQIENHGWSHVDIAILDDRGFANHVHQGRQWLREELGVPGNLYAVPFGLTDVDPARQQWIEDTYFLASPNHPLGRIGSRGWNREDLTRFLQAVAGLSFA